MLELIKIHKVNNVDNDVLSKITCRYLITAKHKEYNQFNFVAYTITHKGAIRKVNRLIEAQIPDRLLNEYKV